MVMRFGDQLLVGQVNNMKKIICSLITYIFFCTSISNAWVLSGITSGVTAVGGGDDCPAGDYTFYWDGDNTSGGLFACTDEDESTLEGSANTFTVEAVGYSGNGVTVISDNAWLGWAITSDDIIDDALGTIWLRVYIASAATADCNLISVEQGAGNGIIFCLEESDDELYGMYLTTAGGVDYANKGPAITTGSWITLAYSWDNAADDHSINVGGTWYDDDDDGINAGLPAPTAFLIGENTIAGNACTPDPIVDEVYVFNTYKQASPY